MRATLAVMWFELRRYRLLPAGAMLLGMMALGAPWLPGYGRLGVHDVRAGAALLAAALVYLVAVLFAGSSILAGGPESETGFHLARPVGWFRLWLGRLLAAEVLAVFSPVMALTPVLLFERHLALPEETPLVALGIAVLPAVLAPLAGVVRLGIRVRSPWLLVLAGGGAVFWLIQVELFRFRLPRALRDAWWDTSHSTLVLLAMVGLLLWLLPALAGSLVAARRAGDHRGAAARGLAATVATMAGSLALAAGFIAWLFAVPPTAIERIAAVTPAPGGTVLLVQARVRRVGVRFSASFLVDSADGTWRRLGGPPAPWLPPAAFDADGDRLAVLEFDRRGTHLDGTRIAVYRLGAGARILGCDFIAPPEPSAFPRLVLSPDGGTLVTLSRGRVTSWEVASGRPLARVAKPDDGTVLLLCPRDDGSVIVAWRRRTLAVGSGPFTLHVALLSAGGNRLRPLWEARDVEPVPILRWTTDGSGRPVVALARRAADGAHTISIRRLEDGAPLFTASLEDPRVVRRALPLGSDAVLVALANKARVGWVLALVRPTGVVRRWELPRISWLVTWPGPEPGTAVVAWGGPGSAATETLLLDPDRAEPIPLGWEVAPAADSWLCAGVPRSGSRAARLFVKRRRELLLWRSGTLAPILHE